MKRKNFIPLVLCGLGLCACTQPGFEGNGIMVVSIGAPSLKSGVEAEIPHPDDFILYIADSKEKIWYNGRYGDSPEEFELPAGSYTVSAYSVEFSSPAFDSPCFSDTQVVVVEKGASIAVRLNCKQSNCAVRAVCEPAFVSSFSECLLVFEGPGGRLDCAPGDERYAFFNPGSISLSLEYDGDGQLLLTRTLDAAEMLEVNLALGEDADLPAGSGVSLQIDTTRSYLAEDYRYGEGMGTDIESAFTVSEARDRAGSKDVWVQGYIVGVASSNTRISFEPPFEKDTNIILGNRSNTTDRRYCLCVELKSGPVRDALNLCTNPGLIGTRVYIKGDLVSAYFGLPGLKGCDEFQLD